MQNDIRALIPELAEQWSEDTDWQFILGVTGRIELAILYGALFWPAFMERDGMVLFAGRERVDEWMQATSGDRTAVEKVMNHAHLFEIHEPGMHAQDLTVSAAQLRAFGERLKAMWSAKLGVDFPDRRFRVELFGDPDVDMGDYQITFWQVRE